MEHLTKLKETEIQKVVHDHISDPSLVLKTESGKRLQILSPGRINPHEGPDFLDVALLVESQIIVGDAEFHRNSSEWFSHEHHNDENFNNVILQIVFKHNTNKKINHDVLVLDPGSLITQTKMDIDKIVELEDLQNFALIRLLRKCTEAQRLINNMKLEKAVVEFSKVFMTRFLERRKRPNYTPDRLQKILNSITDSKVMLFLTNLSNGEDISIADELQVLLKNKIYDEGANFRRELLLNTILPMAVCLADEKSRVALFLWYWSTPALNKYGVLTRKFRDLPQNFLWQQQGMLEYIKEYGQQTNVVAEALQMYGFAEILSFYNQGKSPLDISQLEE